jgi:hypothetical protein
LRQNSKVIATTMPRLGSIPPDSGRRQWMVSRL